MLRKFILCALATLIGASAEAGIQDFSRRYAFALTSEINDYFLAITATENPSATGITYRPNTLPLSGIQVSAYGFTVAYKRDVARNADDDLRKGKTSYEDLRGALTFGSRDEWMLVGYYNRYGGLYIDNTKAVDPTFSGDGFIQRSDISIFNSGVAAIYVFSPDQFSLAAAALQSAQQTESGGSWLGMVGFDGTLFEAADPLVPTGLQSQYGKDAALTSGKFTTLAASVGYGYTLTRYSFFLSGMLLFGGGYQWRQYKVADTTTTSTVNAAKSTMGISLGYNGETLFTGMSLAVNSTEYATQSLRFRSNLQSVRVFLGVRF